MKDPARFGGPKSEDELHRFLAVISNAQGMTEEWRQVADQDFAVNVDYLTAADPYLLHAAGQPFAGRLRLTLERDIRRCLDHVSRPESVARLLAQAVRAVAAENSKVGPTVMCTMVRRDQVRDTSGRFAGGMAPLIPEVQAEANYFKWPRDGDSAHWIFFPDNPGAWPYYGPNIAVGDIQIKGTQMGPAQSPNPRA
jgi:hypothetical protein